MDPDFVRELLLAKAARSDHELFSMDIKDVKDPKVRKQRDRRKVELARWRREVNEARGDVKS